MLAPSSVIKKTAKTALSGNFLKSAAVSCIAVFTYFIGIIIASMLSLVGGDAATIVFLILFTVFVFSPIAIGCLCYFRRLLWGQNDSALIVFRYFSSKDEYKRALRLTIILTLKLLAAALALFFPSLVVRALSSEWFYSVFDLPVPVWTSSLWTLNSILTTLASLLLCFVMLKYYISVFLFVGDDNMHPAEAVNMSAIISRRTGADFFGLVCSFIGWILLSLFVAPLIFTVPYFLMSYCVHCRFAVTAYNREVDKFNLKDTPHYRVDEM